MEDVLDSVMADEREAHYLRLLSVHESAVRRLAFSYERDPARRQDLVQDIWLAVWRALPAFRGDCSERTFIFRIAHNRSVSHIQHWQRRRTETLDDNAAVSTSDADPERSASDRQRQARLQSAVQQLPLGLRQVVVLTLEGLSQREIGEILGISDNNVAVRLSRARGTLARLMNTSGARS
jgi:RNA polymerase sigma factor (sigma-70 family)